MRETVCCDICNWSAISSWVFPSTSQFEDSLIALLLLALSQRFCPPVNGIYANA